MQNLKVYLTRDGWKRDLGETMEDVAKAFRFMIGQTPDQTEAKGKAKLMERILGPSVGLPKGVIHRKDKLISYCERNGIEYASTPREMREGVCIVARLGKGTYQIDYSNKGDFDGLEGNFLVATGGRPLIM